MLRKLIITHHPFFVFVQESKLEQLKHKHVLSIWKDSNIEWTSSPLVGNSGGLVSLWDKGVFELTSSRIERNWIAINGFLKASNFECLLLNIYNLCSLEERAIVWRDMASYMNHLKLPCLLMGNFNEVLPLMDMGSQFFSTNGINDFQAFLQEQNLIEIPLANGKFTWYKGNSKSKLDRMFVTHEWIT